MSLMSTIDPSLKAAGFIGTWNTDIPAGLSVLDKGAADTLAGNVDLAGRPIPLEVALGRTHPDDRGWVFGHIQRARRTGGPISVEFRILTDASEVRWVLTRGQIAPDQTGTMRSCGAYIDTTDSHQGLFLPVEPAEPTEIDPLFAAADRCIEAHAAITQTGYRKLLRLSDMVLMEVGLTLARRLSN